MTTAPIDNIAQLTMLAQALAGGGNRPPGITVVIWVGVLITALVIGGFVMMVLRRNLLSKDGAGGGGAGGLSLDQLRAMHRRGELSQDEYETARAALTSSLTGRPATSMPRPAQRETRRPAPPSGGAIVAPPGYDLTGQPLPQPRTDRGSQGKQNRGDGSNGPGDMGRGGKAGGGGGGRGDKGGGKAG